MSVIKDDPNSQKEDSYRSRFLAAVQKTAFEMAESGDLYGKYDRDDYGAGDEAPAWLRAHLPDEFRTVPLTQVRKAFDALEKKSGGGQWPRKGDSTQGSDERRIENALKRILSEDPEPAKHSEEYQELIDSSEWYEFRVDLYRKRNISQCGCELCGIVRNLDAMALHHKRYELQADASPKDNLPKEKDVIFVCHGRCHWVADYVRINKDKDPHDVRSDEMPANCPLFRGSSE